jgi:hypothetical protein
MENLIIAILLYVAIVAIANCPKSVAKADTDPAAPVDYFPIEEATEPQAKAEPVTVAPEMTWEEMLVDSRTVEFLERMADFMESKIEEVQPAIAATALCPVAPMATAQPEPVQNFTVANDLSRLGVRDLYKLASKAGIKGYKKLSKGALIQALA